MVDKQVTKFRLKCSLELFNATNNNINNTFAGGNLQDCMEKKTEYVGNDLNKDHSDAKMIDSVSHGMI